MIIVFDFDGTLIHSNEIKKKIFIDLSSSFDGGEYVMNDLLNKNYTRDIVFKKFSEVYKINGDKLLKIFSKKVDDQISYRAKVRKGAFNLLNILKKKKISTYINSATPDKNLLKIIRSLSWNKYFKGILGGNSSKEYNLHKISRLEKIDFTGIYFIGDGVDDYRSSALTKCNFIPISGGTLEKQNKNNNNFDYMNNLMDVIKIIGLKND